MKREYKVTDQNERFLVKFTKHQNGCWIWKTFNGETYPMFLFNKTPTRAHRVSFLMFKGAISPGDVVMHTCDNTGCVNPDHLILGSQKQNIHDCMKKKRFVRGTESHLAKLDVRSVVAIRKLWETKKLRQQDLANAFGMSQTAIYKIVNNLKWKELV